MCVCVWAEIDRKKHVDIFSKKFFSFRKRFTDIYIYIYIYIHHATCESTCDTMSSSAANQR